MKKKLVIVHGYEANPESNWFQWLKREAESLGFEVSVPALPDSFHPDLDAWLETLSGVVGTPNENTYFVGHSLGCPTVIQYLNSLPKGQRIGGCILVAGFVWGINPATMPFCEGELDFEKIKSMSDHFVNILSEDDPQVAPERSEDLAVKLGVPPIRLDGYGHFVGSKGVTELPIVLDELKRILGCHPAQE